MVERLPGELGAVGGGILWEAIHADWPAYPSDRSWEIALIRLGDFPLGTTFTCIDVVDQCALLVAGVGIREPNLFSKNHMHVAVRLEELIDLDERGLVRGVEFDGSISPEQLHLKRTLGPELWEEVQSGQTVLGTLVDGVFQPLGLNDIEDAWDDDSWFELRTPERMAIFQGTEIELLPVAEPEIERIARRVLAIPPSLQDRITFFLARNLFDSAIRDLGAALETRMREVTGPGRHGSQLVEHYVTALLQSERFRPARIKSLGQEMRAIFKFVRNEFAHNLVVVPPGRGYALVSRMCWLVRDVELLTEALQVDQQA